MDIASRGSTAALSIFKVLLPVKHEQHSSCSQSVLLLPQEKIAGDESKTSDGAKFQLFQNKGGVLLGLFVPAVTPSSRGSCPGSHSATATVTVLLAQGESGRGSLGRSPKVFEAVFWLKKRILTEKQVKPPK